MPILGGCLCCDLKVGSKVIGVLHLIGAISSTIAMLAAVLFMSVFAVGVREFHKELGKEEADFNKQLKELEDQFKDQQQIDQQKKILDIIMVHSENVLIIMYVILGLAILKVITSSCLIHGVRRNHRGLLIPFVIQEAVMIIVFSVLLIMMFVYLGGNKITGAIATTFIFSFALNIYCILVVISQYQALGLIRMHEDICMK